MTLVYKLTDQNLLTRAGRYNATLWGEGIEHTAPGVGELCSAGWLHAYETPYMAALFNPIHAAITSPILWEADGDIGHKRDHTKVGCSRLKTIRRIPLPKISEANKVTVSMLGVLETSPDPKLTSGLKLWLDGIDNSEDHLFRLSEYLRIRVSANGFQCNPWEEHFYSVLYQYRIKNFYDLEIQVPILLTVISEDSRFKGNLSRLLSSAMRMPYVQDQDQRKEGT